MKAIWVALLVIWMELVAPVPAIAAMSGTKSVSARVTAMFVRDALGWSGHAGLDGRWRISPDWNIWFGGEVRSTPGFTSVRDVGLELTGRYSAGEFSLWAPGKIKLDESGQTAALALETSWRLGRTQVGAELGWEQEWPFGPLHGFRRYHGMVGLQWLAGARFRSNFVLNAAMRQEPGSPGDDYFFGNALFESRWSPGKRTILKTGFELSAYRFPTSPDLDRTRYEITAELSWRPGNWNMRLGGEYEWSVGRLSDNYQFQQVWARADISAWGGILSGWARVDGTVFLDAGTTARDCLHWQLVAGFSRTVGNLSFRIQLFYDADLVEDGTGQWVFGPVAALDWQISERIQARARWAPEGDFSGGADAVELSLSVSI